MPSSAAKVRSVSESAAAAARRVDRRDDLPERVLAAARAANAGGVRPCLRYAAAIPRARAGEQLAGVDAR